MKVICAICGWEGMVDELDKHRPAMDELPSVDACPSCGATNADANVLPALIYI